MTRSANRSVATDLLAEACEWRLIALMLSRPDSSSRAVAQRLAAEVHDSAVADAARAWCKGATEGAYLALLGPGGIVSPRLVAYRGFADPGWMLADIARYHKAFGFRSQADEPPDHVAVLAEFVAYLWLKEAWAREQDDAEAAAITRAARERFADDCLAPIAAPLAERLEACGATDWRAVAQLLAARVPPPPAQVPGIGEAEDVFGCGGCAALPNEME